MTPRKRACNPPTPPGRFARGGENERSHRAHTGAFCGISFLHFCGTRNAIQTANSAYLYFCFSPAMLFKQRNLPIYTLAFRPPCYSSSEICQFILLLFARHVIQAAKSVVVWIQTSKDSERHRRIDTICRFFCIHCGRLPSARCCSGFHSYRRCQRFEHTAA